MYCSHNFRYRGSFLYCAELRKVLVARSRRGRSCDAGVACAEGYASRVHRTYLSYTSNGSSDSAILRISFSYSFLITSLRFFVSEGVGVASLWRGEGENIEARARADRPPGSDCIFSFWFSMISKSIRSSETDILSVFGVSWCCRCGLNFGWECSALWVCYHNVYAKPALPLTTCLSARGIISKYKRRF